LSDFPGLPGQTAHPEDAQARIGSGKVLVVGLGNPGIEYQFTPHNAGFLAIDRIAADHGAAVANRRCRALTATVRIASRDVILAKPETFMNLSGVAVQALVREYEVDARRDLIVLYDEVEFALGTLRIRERGSSGGHNGVKSISGSLRSEEWIRIRIGIAPELPAAAESARRQRKEYVLSPFRKAELALLDGALDRAARAVEVILAQGVGAAMNEFNKKANGREPNSSAGHET
jgi:PTH1 family peptidyl-tRNA hydrolase